MADKCIRILVLVEAHLPVSHQSCDSLNAFEKTWVSRGTAAMGSSVKKKKDKKKDFQVTFARLNCISSAFTEG